MASSLDAVATRVADLAAVVSRVADSATRVVVAATARKSFLRSFAKTTTRFVVGLTGFVAESQKAVTFTTLTATDQVASLVERHATLEARVRSVAAEAALAPAMARALGDLIRAFGSRRHCLPFDDDLRRGDGSDGGSHCSGSVIRAM
ncbi:unnamed protein product [Urochloa humidicola]